MLDALRALPVGGAGDPEGAGRKRDETLQYLAKRREQIDYARFRAAGYPIGSGSVESANKLVVEARLKGPGMHWARGDVNPVLALRGMWCSGLWAERWPGLWRQLRRRHGGVDPTLPGPPNTVPAVPASPISGPKPRPVSARPPKMVDGRPTAAHPWRKPFLHLRRTIPAAKT